MALLIFQAQHDQPEARRIRFQYLWIIGLSMVVMWVATFIGTLYPHFDQQSLITETIVYGWSAFIWFWVAWGRARTMAWTSALTNGLLWALTSVVVIFLTKWGLQIHFLSAGVAAKPYLYWGLLYAIPPFLFGLQVSTKNKLRYYGMHFKQWGWQTWAGILVGALLGLHMITTIRLSGVTSLSLKPLPYMAWTLGYEIFQSLAEEMFFRGVVFRVLQSVFQFNLWQAVSLTIFLNLSIFLIKTSWRSPLETSALLIYLSLLALANCLLFRRFQSILPGTITNVLFSLMSTLRG